MDDDSILNSSFELKVDISTVPHIECRKIYRSISNTECYNIVE